MWYNNDGTGSIGWISANGVDWVAFSENVGFAVEPVFVDASEATVIMQGGQQVGQLTSAGVTSLNAPSPNPFNPSTSLSFLLAKDTHVELANYNVRGELVKRLISEQLDQGNHDVTWFGRDTAGKRVASGVYLAQLKAGGLVFSQPMVLVQ